MSLDAEAFDAWLPRQQVLVLGVGKYELVAHLPQLAGVDALDGPACAHRHEARGLHLAVGGGEDARPRTASNLAGGVQGGISNGEDLVCRIAFKPCLLYTSDAADE